MLIARIRNKLFGWEYWSFSFGGSPEMARAIQGAAGNKWVYYCGKPILIGSDPSYRKWIRVL